MAAIPKTFSHKSNTVLYLSINKRQSFAETIIKTKIDEQLAQLIKTVMIFAARCKQHYKWNWTHSIRRQSVTYNSNCLEKLLFLYCNTLFYGGGALFTKELKYRPNSPSHCLNRFRNCIVIVVKFKQYNFSHIILAAKFKVKII